MTHANKKLIEVALPLEAINNASAIEKGNPFLRGHPRNLHQWWARRPLASARAVIFSQMVDDPSGYVDELLTNPMTRREAEKQYRSQLIAWETRKVTFDKAQRAGMSASTNPNPGYQPTLEGIAAGLERERLFRIIEDLVLWENTTNESVLNKARTEIWKSWKRTCAQNADHPRAKELFDPEKLPVFHDPFAGGGALPLEAQRLGLESYASDLNPVAVLINKTMIELPPRFSGMQPVNPKSRDEMLLMRRDWNGVQGLSDDVRYYSKWMRDKAEKTLEHLYPDIEITSEMAKQRPDLKQYIGRRLKVIAWLWARTVKSPNPAFSNIDVPLVSTFMLSLKPGKEAYIQPIIKADNYQFDIKIGKPKDLDSVKNGTKLARANFVCLISGTPISGDYIKAEGKAKRLNIRLMAVVAEGQRGKVYLPPTPEIEYVARQAKPEWTPDVLISGSSQFLGVKPYGFEQFSDLFTDRQLVLLTTFSDILSEVIGKVKQDALISNYPSDETPLSLGGMGAIAYAQLVATFLALAIDKLADYNNSICMWNPTNQNIGHLFTKQAIPMSWDFSEASPLFGGLAFDSIVEGISKSIESLPVNLPGRAFQMDCSQLSVMSTPPIISTDPPYYDNVPYADISDFFYVWLRHSLKNIFPEIFTTVAVPKAEELVAFAYRHQNGKIGAESFFLDGMTLAMKRLANIANDSFPVTIYYAFKQTESNHDEGTASTGWETFLDAVIRAGFAIGGTWPMRTEREARSRGIGSNALASSIILVCRPQDPNSVPTTRREFVNALKLELPVALANLQAGNIAPVDLAQASIGPGMAVYTRYSKVLDAQGQPLTVRHALALINQTLDEALAEQEGDFDADTRWALAWFEQNGFAEGEYGVAETLSKAKDTSVGGMVDAGILASGRGKVRLLKPAELPADWDPTKDARLTAWEMVHQLVRVLEKDGEAAAAALEAKLGVQAETARELCYRLYTICERKKRSAEALSYNALVQSWPEITRLARETVKIVEIQERLL